MLNISYYLKIFIFILFKFIYFLFSAVTILVWKLFFHDCTISCSVRNFRIPACAGARDKFMLSKCSSERCSPESGRTGTFQHAVLNLNAESEPKSKWISLDSMTKETWSTLFVHLYIKQLTQFLLCLGSQW